MKKEQLETIEWECKHGLYFIEYPHNVSYGVWKDAEGKHHFMSGMNLDHLKACIRLVEKGADYLAGSRREKAVIRALEPLVQDKLGELKEAFRKKAGI
ncbi:hypothetical protein [Pseudomonas sp. MOIL14HWK12:I2]|uniref:hypothetical protein n=1 Tax=Pseudomonas sp. MOIL14HWK12:I2 TaxID=1033994 RepID=UPI00048708E6|nr:hypothetical protein [Pseudomonas sp. MOIL14HWK12:I2]